MRQLCTDKSVYRLRYGSCGGVRVCIRIPHLRTRCCVIIQTFRNGFLHARTVGKRTLCSECPRAGCNRTQCWRPIGSLPHQTHHWLRFCHHTFLFSRCFFLLPLRHGLGFVHRLKACKRTSKNSHDVEQTEKMIPLITGKSACRQKQSTSWFLVSTYLIWNLGSELILSNNQSSTTLWVRDTCPIVTPAFHGHFDHCFIPFKDVEHRTKLRRLHV